jgi:arsenate reductase
MREVCIDPTRLTWDAANASAAVVTMGCGDACPVFPGKRYEDCKLDDPPARASTPSADP